MEWRAIPGYEGWYEASRCGRIRAIRWYHPRWKVIIDKVKELAPLWYRKGYYKVQLGTCGMTREKSRQYVHRVIYRTFHGEIPEGMTVNHKDGTHDNNHANNLELATHAEQSHHAKRLGLLKSRTSTGLKTAHLKAEDVLEIRRQLGLSPRPTKKVLADQYNVSQSLIRFIETRKVWKSL